MIQHFDIDETIKLAMDGLYTPSAENDIDELLSNLAILKEPDRDRDLDIYNCIFKLKGRTYRSFNSIRCTNGMGTSWDIKVPEYTSKLDDAMCLILYGFYISNITSSDPLVNNAYNKVTVESSVYNKINLSGINAIGYTLPIAVCMVGMMLRKELMVYNRKNKNE